MVNNLKLIDYLKDPKARKVFGKKEIEIISKQLEGVPLTQSEKNRLSRDIRKKFEFIADISSLKNEFKLVKNQDNKNLIKSAITVILEDELGKNAQTILLFGSHASSTSTSRSDIDLCVVFPHKLSLKEATMFRIRILGKLSNKFDIQVFSQLPQKITQEITNNSKVLFKSKNHDQLENSLSAKI